VARLFFVVRLFFRSPFFLERLLLVWSLLFPHMLRVSSSRQFFQVLVPFFEIFFLLSPSLPMPPPECVSSPVRRPPTKQTFPSRDFRFVVFFLEDSRRSSAPAASLRRICDCNLGLWVDAAPPPHAFGLFFFRHPLSGSPGRL